MIGLAVFGLIAAYVALIVFMVRKARNTVAKASAIAVALLIPFWDLPIGYWQYHELCSSEGGLHVLRSFPAQDRLFFESPSSLSANQLLKAGWQVVEGLDRDQKTVIRHRIGQNGELMTEKADRPSSKVALSVLRDQRLPWYIVREDQVARAYDDGVPLVKYSSFAWRGGWLQASLAPILGVSQRCFAVRGEPVVSILRKGS
jgi:hypothetical protein